MSLSPRHDFWSAVVTQFLNSRQSEHRPVINSWHGRYELHSRVFGDRVRLCGPSRTALQLESRKS
jgi:hypothetical protein